MATSLDTDRKGLPVVKFREQGQWIDIAVYKVEVGPVTDMVTGAPKLKDNGQPRQQEILSGLVIGGNAVIVQDQDVIPEAGTPVRIMFAGGHWGAMIDATKTLPASASSKQGQREIGDVIRVTYSHNEAATVRGLNDSKIWKVQIRRARPDEAEQSARCEAAARGPATPLGNGGGYSADDEPF